MENKNSFPYKLYLVISQKDCKFDNIFSVAEKAILGGVDLIQLREKDLNSDAFYNVASKLLDITTKYSIPLIINDNVEVAIQLNAEGIHVGNTDMPPVEIRKLWKAPSKIIGYSVEYFEQLKNEQCSVADYLGISPVYSTETKKNTVTEWGLEGIVKIKASTTKPLVAIGNMHKGNVREVLNAGADCIAVVSAICGSLDPYRSAVELKNMIC